MKLRQPHSGAWCQIQRSNPADEAKDDANSSSEEFFFCEHDER